VISTQVPEQPKHVVHKRCATLSLLLLCGLAALAGCRSAFVQADIRNETGQPVSVVEIDYPSASFGVQNLAAGATYHYRFKILGNGPTKVSWTDAAQHDHSANGPELSEGQQGQLTVTLQPTTASWDLQLQR
jgi:hypothetical protein